MMIRNWTATAVLILITSSLGAFEAPSSIAAVDSRYGGTLRVSTNTYFSGFCVQQATSSAPGVFRAVYDPLVERTNEDVLVPYLAQSIVPNTAFTEWTVNLRSGIKYSDGTNFDATNVKLNLDAYRGALWGNLGGASNPAVINLGFTNISDVVVIDNLTVKVSLELPERDFLETLYAGGKGLMRGSAQIADRTTCSTSPIGTGPFTLVSFPNGGSLSFDRNPNYWRTDPNNGNRLPYLDHINIDQISDSGSRGDSLISSSGVPPTADLAFFNSVSDSASITQLRSEQPQLSEFSTRPETLLSIFLNVGKVDSPFRFKNARLAVAYATDTSTLLTQRFGGVGAVPLSTAPRRSQMFTTQNFVKYDLVKAKEYLNLYKQESGQSTLTITIPSDTSAADVALSQLLKTMWAQAGITLNITIEESAVITSKIFRTSGMTYDLAKVSIGYGSETGYATMLMRENAFNPNTIISAYASGVGATNKTALQTIWNPSKHGNQDVDVKFREARSQNTEKLLNSKFRDALAYYQSQTYEIPVVNAIFTAFMNSKVRGLGRNFISADTQAKRWVSGGPDWSTVYINDSAQGTVSVVKEQRHADLGWIGAHPQGLVLLDSNYAYFAKTGEGEICKFSLIDRTVVSCTDVGGRPVGLAINTSGTNIYYVDSQNKSIGKLSIASGATRTVINVTCTPSAVTVNTEEAYGFATCPSTNEVIKFNVLSNTITTSISVSSRPSGVAIEPGGRALWVSQADVNTIARVDLGTESVTQKLSKSVMTSSSTASNSFARSLGASSSLSVGQHPTSLIVSEDGRYFYVVNELDDSISQIETSTQSVLHTISAGQQPGALAIDAKTNKAYVTSVYENALGIIDLPAVVPIVTSTTSTTSTTLAPTTTTTIATVVTTTTTVAPKATVLTVKLSKAASAKSIAAFAKLKVLSTSKVKLKVVASSSRFCRVSGTTLKGLKAGSCKVTVTVTPKKGKAISKTVTLKVTK